ncbi:hypothetical protein I302_108230 [Kwoniella bestiolae CBS 10118]|uniref:Uncharacterized protein n=1 Tax=Kwoniella bestiolae CBS 10118 TaxID=1296100 RepID=A0A1B9FWA1_9TREE|nr:hypothetical protein I302_07405 [Kwoniella bestiolae CBS 10118]OCF23054.1 hypothetical protein I302_07405 [Kwoniella bestiolae CBS 10118]
MGVNAVIPAAVHSTLSHQHQSQHQSSSPYTDNQPQSYANIVKNGNGLTIDQLRAESYGSIASTLEEVEGDFPGSSRRPSPGKGKSVQNDHLYTSGDEEEEDEEEEEFGMEPEIPVTWKYMSRLYLLVPIITMVWLALLILLVTFAWPPTKRERQAGQKYPHPILFKPFLIGIFASCTVQTIRVPVWVVVSWFRLNMGQTTFWSTSLHAIIHELLRLSTLPLITVSPTSGFHSSYYLGLGWGLAEVTYGIIQGWEQIELYKEVMRPSDSLRLDLSSEEENVGSQPQTATQPQFGNGNGKSSGKQEGMLSSVTERSDEGEEEDSQVIYDEPDQDEDEEEEEDEEELERKVEILERMRARRDLEEVIGQPFPNIPFPLHLLWRLDTLLLNLGLTLLLSSFYFNSTPIYKHSPLVVRHDAAVPDTQPHKWLWQVWALVALLHVCVSLVWKVVGRVGIGAVTWGGLIVALGSVFAGLGCWGGLV